MPSENLEEVDQNSDVALTSDKQGVVILVSGYLLLNFIPDFSLEQSHQEFLKLNVAFRYYKILYCLLILMVLEFTCKTLCD